MSDTENVKLGVCTVFFDGTDLGYTKGGVEVEVATTTHEVKIDQFGETPINELVTGRTVTAKVPLAETTLENLVKIMPGARMVSDGAFATGTVTFTTGAPVDGDKITLNGKAYTFKTAPATARDIPIPATFGAAATALAAAINADPDMPFSASEATGVVTITSDWVGIEGNVPLTKTAVTPANITTSGAKLTGGLDGTKAKVVVPTGVNISLLATAKQLVLRPLNTSGAEDFVILKSNTAGGLQFAYKYDDERVFNTTFKGYPANADGDLFEFGDQDAVAA